MSINIIAAIGKNKELGKYNKLIWNLPSDLEFFKETTMGKYVVMGRKTYESIPSNLPGRTKIVLSNSNLEQVSDAICYHNIFDIMENLKKEDLFIIGGQTVYEQFLPYTDIMYLTEIDAVDYQADAYFPNFNKNDWDINNLESGRENGIIYARKKYVRKK